VAAVSATVPPGPVLVALGGGADSSTAAWALVARAPRDPVRAVFVAHGLKGSARLEAAARALTARLEIGITVIQAPVPEQGPSLEDRARRSRLVAIDGNREPGEWIVTGHSMDDLAETVLANLFRGAGSAGLTGIPRRRGSLLRPFLDFTRAQLRAVADEEMLPYADDPANDDLRHLRGRIRHELMPLLAERYNPAIRTVLARTAQLASRDEEALVGAADAVPIIEDAGALLLPVPVLVTVPRAVAARAIRSALRRLFFPYPGVAADVAAVFTVAAGAVERQSLSRDRFAAREGPFVAIHGPSHPDQDPNPIELAVPGAVRFGAYVVRIETAEAPAWRPHGTTLLDAAALGDRVFVRSAGEGERIDIGGGSKPVREALAEDGVPVRLRSAWPTVVVGGKIAAVAGIRVAAWARPRGGEVLKLTNERERR
jgi:tRNA(Ile)-lysidine synthetase-like protein